jgi:hypothetical protein
MEQTSAMSHGEAEHGHESDKNNGNNAGKGRKVSLNSVGSLWCDTWRQYQRQFSVLAEILLLPTLVMILGYVLLEIGGLFAALGVLVAFVGGVVLTYSVLPLIYAIHHGTGVDASYKATLSWFWPFIWVIILEGLAIMGGYFMLIIPGIWLMIALGLMRYVFVVENRRGIDALRQSKEYIKGYWWAFLGRVLLVGIATSAIVLIFDAPIAAIARHTAGSVMALIISLIVGPFTAIYAYRIYQNLRELKPDVVTAERTGAGTGFIKASAIVGLAGIVLAGLAVVALGAFWIATSVVHRGPVQFPAAGDGMNGAPMIPAQGGYGPQQ